MFLAAFVCMFVGLLATKLKNLLTDFDEIFKKCRKWDEKELVIFCG